MKTTTDEADSSTEATFSVTLDNFEGPFDLLLGLIGKHKLDVTEVALSKVTDEFIGYIRFRQQPGVAVLEPDRPREASRLPVQPLLEHRRDLLERAVLQQPREQQVAGLEQREVLLVLHVALRQQPGGLEVEQRRGDQQERRGLLEVPVTGGAGPGLHVRDELVGDLRQRDLGDVELVLGDQAQQQVERTLEVVQAYGERLPARVVRR